MSNDTKCYGLYCGNTFIAMVQLIVHTKYVAVPSRKRTLFRCVVRSHHRVRNAISLNFRSGRGSNALCKHIDSCCVYIPLLSSVLNGSSEISRFKRRDAIEKRNRIMFVFYSGLPHILFTVVWHAWLVLILPTAIH